MGRLRLGSARSRVAVAALAVCAALAVALTAAGPAGAAEWESCAPLSVTTADGSHYRATGVEASQLDCEAAATIVHGFYAQEIGSSGAAEVEGLGCAYTSGGARVVCIERVGDAYVGPRRVRWAQRDAHAAAGPTGVGGCRPFTVFRGHDRVYGSYRYVASHVRRSAAIRCSMARKLLEAAYHGGPLKVTRTVYGHDSHGRRVGRPTYWLRGGWRCSNGAGGALCWNVRKPRLNAVPSELSHGFAVIADVRFAG